MSAISSSMSPGYLRVNPYFDKPVEAEEPLVREEEQEETQKPEQKSSARLDVPKNEGDTEKVQKDVETQTQIAKLKLIETEVIAHEAAHMAVGGQFAGGASYSYTQGPDGKRYITGGEVSIGIPASDDPEETIRMAEQVKAAALAPASPSSQDLSVAAAAAGVATAARGEITAGNTETKSPKNEEAEKSYKISSSPKGLWTVNGGYEKNGEDEEPEELKRAQEFSLAA